MGLAHGQLMKDKAQQLVNDVWAYMELQVVCLLFPYMVVILIACIGGGYQWNCEHFPGLVSS